MNWRRLLLWWALGATVFGTPAHGTVFVDLLSDYTGTWPSQDFEAQFDGIDCILLEDFAIASSTRLTKVTAGLGSSYYNNASLAGVQYWQVKVFTSADVAELSDIGDAADVIVAVGDASIGPGVPSQTPSWTVTLPIDIVLGPGSYLFGVRPQLDYAVGNRVGIGRVNMGTGNAVLANPNGGLMFGPTLNMGDGGAYKLEGTAVPEPSTWVLLIAGFGLVGALQRRQRVRFRHPSDQRRYAFSHG